MENISLDKKMIEQIEAISRMNYGETYDEWRIEIGDDESIPPNIKQMKLDLSFLRYSLKNGEDPTKEVVNKMKYYLECLDMEKRIAA